MRFVKFIRYSSSVFPQLVFADTDVFVPYEGVAAGFDFEILEEGELSQWCKHWFFEQGSNTVLSNL